MVWYELLFLKLSTQIIQRSQNSLLHHPSPIPSSSFFSSSSSFAPSAILLFLSYLSWPRLLGVVRFCHNHLGDWGPVPTAELSRERERGKRGWERKEGGVWRWGLCWDEQWRTVLQRGKTACLAQPWLMWGDSLGFALTTLAPSVPGGAARRE